MCALRNMLKRLEELIVKQKYDDHIVVPYSTIELWQKVRDGQEDEIFQVVSPEVKEMLIHIKETELQKRIRARKKAVRKRSADSFQTPSATGPEQKETDYKMMR